MPEGNRIMFMLLRRRLYSHYALAGILALLLTFSGAAQKRPDCNVRITLLQVNDVYQFAPVDHGAHGGLARLGTLRKMIAATSPNTLFLLGGDTISPSVESNTYKGKQMIEAWNAVGLDYSVFGNHEFDFGDAVLKDRISESKFKWLAANVVDSKTGKTFGNVPEYEIRDMGGVKVGIFGIVLPETKNTSRPGPDVQFLNPCDTAKRVVSEMRSKGAQVVVGLTHLAMGQDKVVAQCAPIDIILGGHEHTLLQSISGHTPIFKMTADGREMGRYDLTVNPTTGKVESIDWQVIPVTDQIKDDSDFATVAAKYKELLDDLAKPVGRTDVQLDARSAANRTIETNVADFIADAFRKATGADVTLINGGSVRADLTFNPGDLTKREVLSILPFANPVVKIEVSGDMIRQALESGVSRSAEESEPGRFPQVSGMRYAFDASMPAGSRIVEVTINGQPLENKKTYSLATTTFIASDGGDGYSVLKGRKMLIGPDKAQSAPDILQNAIASVPSIAPRTDGRIRRLDTKRAAANGADCN
jgi:5'-nucleotidase